MFSVGSRWLQRLAIAFSFIAFDYSCECFELRAHQLRQKELERLDAYDNGEYASDMRLQVYLKPQLSNAVADDALDQPIAVNDERWLLRRSRISPNVFDPDNATFEQNGGKNLVNGIVNIGSIGALPHGVNAAEIVGIRSNQEGDGAAFAAALIGNGLFIIIIFVGFTFHLRYTYPAIFQNNVDDPASKLSKAIRERLTESYWSWFVVSWKITVDEVADNVGLDSAMLLDFTHMGMKVFGILAVPLMLVMGPLDAVYGGDAAGSDRLSLPTMNNIEPGSWLYWIYPFIVWGVTFVVTEFVHSSKEQFIKRRHRHLMNIPFPRSTSLMVEGIPPEFQTDSKLEEFFGKMLGRRFIKEAFVVKKLPKLENARHRKDSALLGKSSTTWRLAMEKFADLQEIKATLLMEQKDYDRDLEEAERDIAREWQIAEAQFENPNGKNTINTSTGFVTFNDRRVREIALLLQYNEHGREWKTGVPPAPESINWKTLKMPFFFKGFWQAVGYFLLILLGIFYLPIVLYISVGAASVNLGWLEPVWVAFAPSAGLTIMVSLLPSCFGVVARNFFPLKDEGQFQDVIQRWGFIFQTCFVILVPAIGSSLTSFVERVARSPLSVFSILSSTMPNSTHFYMNYLVLQMTFQVLNLWRYMNLARYFSFRALFSPEEARKMSEPEDQDYCGIGNRCANFVLFFNIGIVFGTLCPYILVEAIIMFALCRLTYGYLLVYAETLPTAPDNKKSDVGGHFWDKQMCHLLLGLGIYCVLMSGVFIQYAPNVICGVICLPTIIYVWRSYYNYVHDYNWKTVPWELMMEEADPDSDSVASARDSLSQINYEQPEIRASRAEAGSQSEIRSSSWFVSDAVRQDRSHSGAFFEDLLDGVDRQKHQSLPSVSE